MADKLWKSVERRVAAILGGERVPVTGRQRGSAPDIKHDFLSIEVKQRKSLPAWLDDAMKQAEASKASGQLPVVVLHQTGNRIENAYVVMRLGCYLDYFAKNGRKIEGP